MYLLIAYLLLAKWELHKKKRFDMLLTAMELMEESYNSDSSIINLTADDTSSIAEFVDLSKTLEVVDLCSSSSGSSDDSSVGFLKLMPCLLQGQCESDTSSSGTSFSSGGTGGGTGLPHPQLIGLLV